MRYFTYIIICFLLVFSTQSLAQTKASTNLFFNAGLAFPSMPKDFSNYWETGFNFGAGVGFPLSESITLIGAIDYNTFPLNKDNFLKAFGLSGKGVSLTGGATSIISVSGNFKLLLNITQNTVAPYVILGLGYFYLSDADVTLGYQSHSESLKGTSESAFILLPGVGIQIPIGATELFIEGRYNLAFTNNESTAYIPIKLGIQINI